MEFDNELFQEYINLDCLVEKAVLLKKIREETGLPYVILELDLYEDSRTLKRVYKINDLIPQYQQLLKNKKLPKVVAYHISSLSIEKQEEIYALFKDRLISWKTRDVLSNLKTVETNTYMDNNILMNKLLEKHETEMELQQQEDLSSLYHKGHLDLNNDQLAFKLDLDK